MRDARVSTASTGKHRQDVVIGPHHLVSDEPVEAGGEDAGPAPHELILAALGSCTSMTLRIYAERKGWPLERVAVRLTREKLEGATVLRRTITLEGPLDPAQRAKLLEIAGKCPVHRTLTGEIRIESDLDA